MPNRRILLLVFILFVFSSLLLYSPTLRSSFLSDDWTYLAAARDRPVTLASYFLNNIEGKREGGVYRPLVSISFLLNYKTSGLTAWPYHLFNILAHALNAWLLFVLVKMLAREKEDSWLPALAGFFFLILPAHAEAVGWLSSRGDLLATTFFLSALIFYILFRRRSQKKFLAASLAAFGAALLSKEMALTMPLVIILYETLAQIDRARSPAKTSRIIFYLLPYLILVAIYLLLRFLSTGIFLGFYAAPNLKINFGNLAQNLANYILSQIFHGPSRLALFNLAARHQFVFWLSLLGGQVHLWRFLKSRRQLVWFSILFFGLTILPVIALPLGRLDSEGERFVYLSSLGFCLLLALVFSEKPRLLSYCGAALLAGYFIFFLTQKNAVWAQAGQLAQNLLSDFGQNIDPRERQGVVILGIPDSLDGAYIWRNGFPQALSLVYPDYQPDVLVAQPKLKLLKPEAIISWQALPEGRFTAAAKRSEARFFGPRFLESLDYEMRLKNYEPPVWSGDAVELKFTKAFREQLKFKAITFLVYSDRGLHKLAPP